MRELAVPRTGPVRRCDSWKLGARPAVRVLLQSLALAAIAFAMARPAPAQPVPSENGGPPETNGGTESAPASGPQVAVPPVVPEVMTMENPLLTTEQEKQLRRELLLDKYSRLVTAGVWNSKTEPVLVKGIEYGLKRLTMKEHRRELEDLRQEILRDAVNAGKLQDNPTLRRSFRDRYLGELTRQAGELVEGQNFAVRMNIVVLLSQLELIPGNAQKQTAPVAFEPAAEPLLKVIKSPGQHPAVKVRAAQGLERILVKDEPGIPTKTRKLEIADALIAELSRRETHFWYQLSLIDALSAVDEPVNGRGDPFVVDALARVVVDEKRHCIARTRAAKSLGRVPLDSSVKVDVLAIGMAKLASQMNRQYNANPQASYWRTCYFNLYLAFRPDGKNEQVRDAGLLNRVAGSRFEKPVAEAYGHILPALQHVIVQAGPRAENRSPVPGNLTQQLDDWLSNNQPADYRVAPGLEPIAARSN